MNPFDPASGAPKTPQENPGRRLGWAASVGQVYQARNGMFVLIADYHVYAVRPLSTLKSVDILLQGILPYADQPEETWPCLNYDEIGTFLGFEPGSTSLSRDIRPYLKKADLDLVKLISPTPKTVFNNQ